MHRRYQPLPPFLQPHRNKLASVKGDSSELEAMIKEAAEVVKAARSEVSLLAPRQRTL